MRACCPKAVRIIRAGRGRGLDLDGWREDGVPKAQARSDTTALKRAVAAGDASVLKGTAKRQKMKTLKNLNR